MDRRQHEEEVRVDEAAATTGQRRYSKLEEALEIKSLRRIISAYLKYSPPQFPPLSIDSVACNKSRLFSLPLVVLSVSADFEGKGSMMALLSHLPLKYKRLRRCVSVNTYFIMSMLQAFDPPLDMSQDIDIDDHEDLQNVSKSHQAEGPKCSVEKNVFSEQPLPICGSDAYVSEPINSGEENNLTDESLEATTKEEEIHMEVSHGSHVEKFVSSEKQKQSCNGNINDVKVVTDPAACCSNPDASIRATHLAHTWMDPSVQLNVPLVDVDKVRCIIRNIVRDWAAEGQKERDQCYKPILEELNRLFPHCSKNRPPYCLVPGAGLGRLALEISCLVLKWLVNGRFILGSTAIVILFQIVTNFGLFHFQIFIHQGITEGFSMCAGDFVEVYNDESQEAYWDAVVTCFFVDTAHNIVEYIETISKLLKTGGVWVNLGPLLYHFADSYGPEDEMSIELSLEDVKKIAFHFGFVMEKEKVIETTYTANPRSMMQTVQTDHAI
ncbi:N2227-like protein [Musa troglodytarum]|uniref:carnosine N-methyltransferase n=1 Tax=Musa troglodytarum TaxID=320322 RepID=A0A9E7GZ09_9LILI|nr:N2227-like protein [Musa troglodytarum]